MLLSILFDNTAAQQPYDSAIAPHMIAVHLNIIADDRACTADVAGSSHFSPARQHVFHMNCLTISIRTYSHVCTAIQSCHYPDERNQLTHTHTRAVGTVRIQLPSLTERGHMARIARESRERITRITRITNQHEHEMKFTHLSP